MRGTSKWAHKQGKRYHAIAYGCYLPDDDPNPLDVDRDADRAEKAAELERRKESRLVIASVKRASKGQALVGEWIPDR